MEIRQREIEQNLEFYKTFYDQHRISILQYNSLRLHFNAMVTAVLGEDYYNYAMDVYQSDITCCEDIMKKSRKTDE